jgi:lantibiotic modifying enzyme
MDPTFPRVMPNFSHGTAGVATFLASLHAATGDEAFLEAAIDGARHLESIADTSDGGFRIHHHTPDGTELFYLGWCHGPPGTARLFERLAQVTGDATWRSRVRQALHTLHECGLPATRPPGLWDNVSICCGTAGIGDFALAQRDLPFARTLADDLLTRARRTDTGLCWPQAEHRTRPDLIQAQTGLMQGAAGVGIFLLRIDGGLGEDPGRMRMPDDPF